MVLLEEERFGLTLIETLVSILLVIILVVSIDVLLISKTLEERGNRATLANALAQEEMEKLLNRGVVNLTNTTSAPFMDILYHEGAHTVAADALSHSAPNLLDLTSDASLTSNVTGAIVAPKNIYADAAIDARLLLRGGSPAGSGKGIFFHAQDKKNGYLLTITNTAVRLLKIVNGVETTLYSSAYFVVLDAWDRFELTLTGGTIDLRLNGISQFTVTDSTFTDGYLAFVATNGARVAVDTVTITDGSGISLWNFDTLPIGNLKGEWQRQSLRDLPGGTGAIDIANYLGNAAIKDIAVRVSWNEAGVSKTVEFKTLLAK